MSRIFDALRQSEQDKQPGSERWNLPPDGTNEPVLSPEQESTEDRAGPTLLPDEGALDLSWLPPAAPSGSQIADVIESRLAALANAEPPPSGVPKFTLEGRVGAASLQSSEVSGPEIDLSQLKVIPVSSIPSSMLVALNGERGLGAEKFRVLCARLSNIRMGTKLGVLQVTSSVVGEGKTLTSVNLGMTLATRFAQKVLLVEGDLRKPAVCALLGMKEHDGIGEWWQQPSTPLSDLLLRIGETGMCVLPAGNVAHPASVLQSPRIAELISELARQFDWVIIDTPPLLPMADSNLWSRLSDGTLLVVRKGTVSRAALKKAVESLDNPKLVGIVLNDASGYDRVNYYDQYYTARGESDGLGKAGSQ